MGPLGKKRMIYINRKRTIILYVTVTMEGSARERTESSDCRIKPWKGGLDCKGLGLHASGINAEWD